MDLLRLDSTETPLGDSKLDQSCSKLFRLWLGCARMVEPGMTRPDCRTTRAVRWKRIDALGHRRRTSRVLVEQLDVFGVAFRDVKLVWEFP